MNLRLRDIYSAAKQLIYHPWCHCWGFFFLCLVEVNDLKMWSAGALSCSRRPAAIGCKQT